MSQSYNLRVPCSLDVPEAYLEKARYAVRMLLLPFRVEPEWVSPDRLHEGGIYYGTNPDNVTTSAWRIGLCGTTLSFFDENSPEPPHDRMVTLAGFDVPSLFECTGDAPFDVVAATFFFLSGWQEVFSESRDEHGRFLFETSLQHRLDFVTVPVVELYRLLAKTELGKRGLDMESKQWGDATWVFCPTHDIDYVRKWRPGILYREIVERAVFNSAQETVSARIGRASAALTGLLLPGDPYRRALKRMKTEVARRGGRATYFFKTAARGPNDVRYAPDSAFLQEQYLDLRHAGFEVALHPSYHAYNHGRYLREERDELRRVSGADVTTARTHFLRFDAPATARLLAETGFRIDSSLGFATHEGFRHGTCQPFLLYDLRDDVPLDVWELPLMVMESTLFNRRHLDALRAIDRTREIMDTCRRYNGIFVGLWHNILWDESDCPGWGEHFTTCLDYAGRERAMVTSLRSALESWN